MPLRAIPSRNARATRLTAGVRAVARQCATALRMQRALRQRGVPPTLPTDVILTVRPCRESKLHRQGLPTGATVAASLLAARLIDPHAVAQWLASGAR